MTLIARIVLVPALAAGFVMGGLMTAGCAPAHRPQAARLPPERAETGAVMRPASDPAWPEVLADPEPDPMVGEPIGPQDRRPDAIAPGPDRPVDPQPLRPDVPAAPGPVVPAPQPGVPQAPIVPMDPTWQPAPAPVQPVPVPADPAPAPQPAPEPAEPQEPQPQPVEQEAQ